MSLGRLILDAAATDFKFSSSSNKSQVSPVTNTAAIPASFAASAFTKLSSNITARDGSEYLIQIKYSEKLLDSIWLEKVYAVHFVQTLPYAQTV